MAMRSNWQEQQDLPQSRADFKVAIICALPLEYDAINYLLDRSFNDEGASFGRAEGDDNHYTTGRVGTENVVVVLLDRTGPNSAAKSSTSLKLSYGNIKLALLVGVCGGLPTIDEREAILGDVIISQTVKQYQVGKHYPGGFEITNEWKDMLGQAPRDIRNLIRLFETSTDRRKLREKAMVNLQVMQQAALEAQAYEDYARPEPHTDRLFPSDYIHQCKRKCVFCSKGENCHRAIKLSCENLDCDMSVLENRQRLNPEASYPNPEIFVGAIASGGSVIKSGAFRDELADELGVVGFEKEGAGIWGDLPCLVIKGMCDYADSHKSKGWQNYAALSATAVAKAAIERYFSSATTSAASSRTFAAPSVPSVAGGEAFLSILTTLIDHQ